MKKIESEEMKKLELEILLAFARYCEERGLTYWIAYGTLLGAVRHKGFIPWDDDVDVLMPREDYEILIREFRHPVYRLIDPLEPVSRHSFVKIVDTRTVKRETNFDYAPGELGIDIDVFPLDGQPEDEAELAVWFEKLMGWYRLADFPVRRVHDCRRKRLILGLINLFGGKRHRLGSQIKRFCLGRARALHGRYPLGTGQYVGMVEHCFESTWQRFDREIFEGTVKLEFEGHLFSAPAGYDAFLRNRYGEYMKLPPPEERFSHKLDEVYWK